MGFKLFIAFSVLFCLFCISFKKPFNTIPSTVIKIGDSFGGGIVFYLDNTGKHGLISAPNDQSSGIAWWNGTNVSTFAKGIIIGTGKANTDAIINIQGAGTYAA